LDTGTKTEARTFSVGPVKRRSGVVRQSSKFSWWKCYFCWLKFNLFHCSNVLIQGTDIEFREM